MTRSKKIAGLLSCFVAAAGLSTLSLGQTIAPQIAWSATTASFVPDEVLVAFAPDSTAQMRSDIVASLGDRSMNATFRSGRLLRVKLAPGRTVVQAITGYRAMAGVRSVQPNYIYHATLAPADTQYGQLWAFKNSGQTVATGTYVPASGTVGDDMNIEPAWSHISDCSGVVVAVVDSGVNYNQQDLAANMWNGNPSYPNHGWDYVDNDNDPMDLNGHGTHVAGIIGAVGDNNAGTTGVCWKASIMAVRVLDASGSGTTADIIQGIDFAVANGAKVINMSLGGGGVLDPLFSGAITAAQASDVVVVVAAGNETNDNDAVGAARYPCNFTQPNLICVAALDQNFALANFSNWGAISVDIGAPGTNILSTWAGTVALRPDAFNTGGTLDWTNSPGSGWAYKKLSLSSGQADALVNPSTFPSSSTGYANNADDRAFKTFDLTTVNAATLNFFAAVEILAGDSLNVNFLSGAGDPFVGGTTLIGGSGSTSGILVPFSFDISSCAGTSCSIGFQLKSDASGASLGAGIAGFSVDTLTLNTTTYNTISGTSMATPEVAGVATMLRAFNPQYQYADVVNAIKNGGRAAPSLAGKSTTGKVVDAMGALTYINPPTGVIAAIVPPP
jgi:thermitase